MNDGRFYSVANLLVGMSARLRNGRNLLMLKAFFDDSGSHPLGEMYVVAGYVARVEQWQEFEVEWAEALRRHRLSCLKTEQAHHRSKEFAGLKRDQAESLLEELADIVVRHVSHEFSVQVPRPPFDRITRGTESLSKPKFKSPYLLCYRELNVHLRVLIPEFFGIKEAMLDIVLDEQALVKGILLDAMRESESVLGAAEVATLTFASDKVVLPLQAADMIAWCLHRAATAGTPAWACRLLALPAMRLRVDEARIREFAQGLGQAVRSEANQKGASGGRPRGERPGNARSARRPRNPGAEA